MKICKSCGRIQFKAGATCFNCGSEEIVDTRTYATDEETAEADDSASPPEPEVTDTGFFEEAETEPEYEPESDEPVYEEPAPAPAFMEIDSAFSAPSDDEELTTADEFAFEAAADDEPAMGEFGFEPASAEPEPEPEPEPVSETPVMDIDDLEQVLVEVELAVTGDDKPPAAGEKSYQGEFYQAVEDAPPPPWKLAQEDASSEAEKEPEPEPEPEPIPEPEPEPASEPEPVSEPEPAAIAEPDFGKKSKKKGKKDKNKEKEAEFIEAPALKARQIEDFDEVFIEMVKSKGTSPQFLAGAALFSLVSILAAFINIFKTTDAVDIFSEIGKNPVALNGLFFILMLVPAVIYAMGFILLTGSLSSSAMPLKKVPGLAVIKFGALANIASSAFYAYMQFADTKEFAIINTIALVLTLVITVLTIWLYTEIVKVTGNVNTILLKGEYSGTIGKNLPTVIIALAGAKLVKFFLLIIMDKADAANGIGIIGVLGTVLIALVLKNFISDFNSTESSVTGNKSKK